MAQLAEPKIAVFIDWHNIKSRKHDIDFNALLAYIHTLGRPCRQFIYLVDFDQPREDYQRWYKKFVKMLENRHFAVKEKLVDMIVDGDTNELITDGNLDVELSIDVMKTLYQVPDLDTVVLFSGDGDFQALLWEVRRFRRYNPIKTIVVSRRNKINKRRLADHADQYIHLEDIAGQITLARPA